ncbi:MAG: hypothetical protein FD153_1660 [Rhodospirillaceae bacterium]|nr:MAG: hypothetical protein FD153_1660 [Rhodospirillaceae bacterium]
MRCELRLMDALSGVGCFAAHPGPLTLPVPENLPVRVLEDLPDHSVGSAEGDLMVQEETLA